MKKLILLLFIATSSNAKEVYIVFDYKENNQIKSDQVSYVVQPRDKVWVFQNFISEEHGLAQGKYALAQKTSKGLVRLDPNADLANYGDSPDSPVLFYIVQTNSTTTN
jgi:hypothetical protein